MFTKMFFCQPYYTLCFKRDFAIVVIVNDSVHYTTMKWTNK